MYEASRLYINFFQPSFKLKSKTRDGARVQKKYHAPKTPCDRLLALPCIDEATKSVLREQCEALDPVGLLHAIREAQQQLADMTTQRSTAPVASPVKADVATFLHSLSTVWKEGEVRPTHRKKQGAPRWWKTRADPFVHAWPVVDQWLMNEPTVSAKELLERLAVMLPDAYAGTSHLRTLQRRVQQWRAEQAKNMILGSLARAKLRA
jgi:hypothetical protein